MRPPRTYEALLGWILLILGGVFTLLGLLFGLLSIPVRNGDTRSFLLGGVPLLLFGAGLLCYARLRERSWNRLRAEGRPVTGQLVLGATRHHWYVSFGSDGFRGRSPWTVLCIYRWKDGTRSVRSQFLWQKPREEEQHPTVYVDPSNPSRAWVDPDTLEYEL